MGEKTRFFCTDCGQESLKWVGRCPGCGVWNTMVEGLVAKKSKEPRLRTVENPLVPLGSVTALGKTRILTHSPELDLVLGGGVVPGSVVLVGGDPGIGKSTLMLQAAHALVSQGRKVVYASGEESLEQIRLRAERLDARAGELLVTTETDVSQLITLLQAAAPEVVVVDSIQTMYNNVLPSAPGSVGQIRECSALLIRLAKESGMSIFLVGHVTKEGAIAGPRVLEHMVDAVLYFEGERHLAFRLLRAVKNRFGSTNEVGVFQMGLRGLVDVANPSELLLTERPVDVAGSVVVPIIEGTRPLLVELQALLSPANYGNPRRTTSGVESNRVAMILAVLERRAGLDITHHDSYVNAVGGMKVGDPAADLAIAVCLASSLRNTRINRQLAVVGEVGLTGEVRGVSRIETRAAEVAKLGFKHFIVPSRHSKELNALGGAMTLYPVDNLGEALQVAWNL
ncbi:MAG: DNA repair protein RadA [Firmicutes bacterium]|nr:DNA repair protein RadA [Bacillota bacterium]MBT9157852.1 DNA repair protein RadA [Bacillota bacterium]